MKANKITRYFIGFVLMTVVFMLAGCKDDDDPKLGHPYSQLYVSFDLCNFPMEILDFDYSYTTMDVDEDSIWIRITRGKPGSGQEVIIVDTFYCAVDWPVSITGDSDYYFDAEYIAKSKEYRDTVTQSHTRHYKGATLNHNEFATLQMPGFEKRIAYITLRLRAEKWFISCPCRENPCEYKRPPFKYM